MQSQQGNSTEPVAVLRQFLEQVPQTRRLLIGYSGGLDSHVLLQAATACRSQRPDLEFSAVHIDHGMQEGSAAWANHCRNICRDLHVPIRVLRTTVKVSPQQGPEASARIARYSLFAGVMQEGDYLLLAQHADDQAETFLLQALRGSGPDGLASIPRKRPFANGWLCRPLLSLNRAELESYAQHAGLRWIEDPSNQDSNLDRNFLRNEVMPLLQQRWPALNQTLSRSASRCGAASQLLLTLAAEDLALVRIADGPELDISLLLSLGQERFFNALRLWVRDSGLPLPRLQDLREVEKSLLRARQDTAGVVQIGNYEFRRYRDKLYLLTEQPPSEPFQHIWPAPFDDLHIPETGQTLTRAACLSQGLQLDTASSVQVRSRQGGELIKTGQPAYHKAVKKLLQESQVPPWQRDSIPLVYIDGRLAAVWNVMVAGDFQIQEPVT